jgi:hypothetical protein
METAIQCEDAPLFREDQGHSSIIHYSLAGRTPSKGCIDDVSRGKSLLFPFFGIKADLCHNNKRQQLSVQRSALSLLSYFREEEGQTRQSATTTAGKP